MTDYADLEQRIRNFADNCDAQGDGIEAGDFVRSIADALDALTRERDELRVSVIAFAAPHAARYAQEFGLPPGELHPMHYDILERCGARLADFRRGACLSRPSDKGETT